MPKRGANFRVIALGLIAAVVAVVLTLGALTWITRTSGPAVRVTSEEGGVSVSVPRNWTVDKKHPTDPAHAEYLNGHENAAFGFLQRGGFWVARWPASADTTLADLKARKERRQARHPSDNWSVRDERVGGHAAIFERFSRVPHGFDRLRLGATQLVVRELLANGFVVQVGTWTLPHAGEVARQLDAVAQSLEVGQPKPWRAELRHDAHITMRGGWSERTTKLKGAIFFALGPGDPSEAWAYVFHYAAATPAASLRTARTNITKRGGAITGEHDDELDGRAVTRLDFSFPDDEYGNADDAEWFVSDGDGGTYVVAVGRRFGDEHIHERIAKTWHFS